MRRYCNYTVINNKHNNYMIVSLDKYILLSGWLRNWTNSVTEATIYLLLTVHSYCFRAKGVVLCSQKAFLLPYNTQPLALSWSSFLLFFLHLLCLWMQSKDTKGSRGKCSMRSYEKKWTKDWEGKSKKLNIPHSREKEREIKMGKKQKKKGKEIKRKGSRSNPVQLQQELRRKVKWFGDGGGILSNLM